MTTKSASASLSKQDAKYLALINQQLQQMDIIRAEMKGTRAEIKRLKEASERKLARIDALLSRV